MTIPLQITFRDLPSSPAVEAEIRERAENLAHIFGRMTSCRVIVEGRHRPQRAGKVFHLRVELTLLSFTRVTTSLSRCALPSILRAVNLSITRAAAATPPRVRICPH